MTAGEDVSTTFWLHRRQYVIGPTARKVRPDWETVQLGRGLVLSHCPALSVVQTTDREGIVWTLAGLAIQADPDRPAPAADIAANGTASVPDRTYSWAGSWILIGNGVLYPDACAMRPCYHCTVPTALGVSALWASSSLALLTDLLAENGAPPRAIGFPGPTVYFAVPPPLTSFEGVRRLLATQTLTLTTGALTPRPFEIDAPSDVAYAVSLERLEAYLMTLFRNAAAETETLWLTLTAGQDTRLLLAAAMASGIELRTFTQLYPFMLDSDRSLPPRLASAVGVDHELVRPRRADPTRAELFDRHCAGQSFGQAKMSFVRDQWSFARPTDIFVAGTVLEVGRSYYHGRLDRTDPLERPADASQLHKVFVDVDAPHILKGFEAWVDHAREVPIRNLDWRDRFFIEVIMGASTGSRGQSLDLGAPRRLMPSNAMCIIRTMLAMPYDLRSAARHHHDLIARLCPALAEFPYNLPDRPWRNRVKRAGGFVWWTRKHGVHAGTAKLYGFVRNGGLRKV